MNLNQSSEAILKPKISIAARLFKSVFLCYCAVTVFVTCGQLVTEYLQTKHNIVDTLESTEQIFGSSLSKALWMMNRESLKSILLGIQELPVVVGVKVEDETGAIIQTVGKFEDKDLVDALFSRSFLIRFTGEDGESKIIGKTTIYSDQNRVINQIKFGFLIIAINAAVKTLALWFIFIFIVNRYLSQPLEKLLSAIRKIQWDQPNASKLQLENRDNDELHLIEISFNEMLIRLQKF